MKAVSENDPDFVPEVETAWRDSLKDGIALLKSKY